MTYISADTAEIIDCIDKLEKNIKDYNQNITDFFDKIRNIPVLTKDWVGDTANSYVELILSRESKYTEFGELLINFNELLKITYENLNNAVKNSEIEGEAND